MTVRARSEPSRAATYTVVLTKGDEEVIKVVPKVALFVACVVVSAQPLGRE